MVGLRRQYTHTKPRVGGFTKVIETLYWNYMVLFLVMLILMKNKTSFFKKMSYSI